MKASIEVSQSFREKYFEQPKETPKTQTNSQESNTCSKPAKTEKTKSEPVQMKQEIPEPVQIKQEIPEPVQIKQEIPEPVQIKKEIPEPVKEIPIEKKPKVKEEPKIQSKPLTLEELNELDLLKVETQRLKLENRQLLYQQGRLTRNLEDAKEEFIKTELKKLKEYMPKRNLNKLYPCESQQISLQKCYSSNTNDSLVCQKLAQEFLTCSKNTRSKFLNSFFI